MNENNQVQQRFEQTMLYDFYGELLTGHQKAIYEDVLLNDMSPSEIAQDYGISRQAVHDLLKRINKILNDYESKLHLVAKFAHAKTKVEQIRSLAQECEMLQQDREAHSKVSREEFREQLQTIQQISDSILEDF